MISTILYWRDLKNELPTPDGKGPTRETPILPSVRNITKVMMSSLNKLNVFSTEWIEELVLWIWIQIWNENELKTQEIAKSITEVDTIGHMRVAMFVKKKILPLHTKPTESQVWHSPRVVTKQTCLNIRPVIAKISPLPERGWLWPRSPVAVSQESGFCRQLYHKTA